MATGESGREEDTSLAGTQVDLIASRVEAITHQLRASSASLRSEARGEKLASRAQVTEHELRAAAANLQALADPTRQLEELQRVGQR